MVFSGEVDVFANGDSRKREELGKWKRDVMELKVDALKASINSFELEERRRLLRERHARECEERDRATIEALKSAGL